MNGLVVRIKLLRRLGDASHPVVGRASLPGHCAIVKAMKVLFVTAIFNMNLRGLLGRGIQLPHGLLLTNDPAQIVRHLSHKFEVLAGQIETDALRTSQAAIYSVFDQPETMLADQDEARRCINAKLEAVLLYLLVLWLIKDNAVNVELGFLAYPHEHLSHMVVTSNFRAVRFSKANCITDATEFSEGEVRDARDVLSRLFTERAVDIETSGHVVPDDFSRLSRLFYFIQGARSVPDLGNRIAFYVTCFECLFCTDASEMSHKLSERVAFFLADSPAERAQIYKQMKTAYNIRSKAVHGDRISKRLAEQAIPISVACDEYLRAALMKILTTKGLLELFLGNSQRFEDYITSLILGAADSDNNQDTQG